MLVLTASSSGSGVNAETQCSQLVSDQEDTVCFVPVLCGIQDGMLKKVSHCYKTNGNPTVKLYAFYF